MHDQQDIIISIGSCFTSVTAPKLTWTDRAKPQEVSDSVPVLVVTIRTTKFREYLATAIGGVGQGGVLMCSTLDTVGVLSSHFAILYYIGY